jgi:hypothetical protein
MARPRLVDVGVVHVQRRDNDCIVETLIPVVNRTADVTESDDCWKITQSNGDRHWYPKDGLLGLVIRSEESSVEVSRNAAGAA